MSTSFLRAINVRAGIALIGFGSILFAPWWVPVVCMVVLAIRYPAWEAPLIGLCIDLVWLSGGSVSVPIFTIGAVLGVWLLTPLRNQLLTH